MTQTANQQLDAIHSMFSAGHRNLRVERHSLMLWGVGCGSLILASSHILTSEQYPDVKQRAFAWLILLTLAVSGIAMLDWHLTRRVKQARDETWSFIHQQVLKVLWLLMAVGVLLTFATFFYGGGHMIFASWVVLVGLGLYVHGLFSEELLEWVGAIAIVIGIAMLAFRLNYPDLQWVSASTLGLGLPLLTLMLDRGRERAAKVRLLQSVGWLLCVLVPPLLVHHFGAREPLQEAPVVSLEEFRHQSGALQAVSLPAGTSIPVKVELSGNMFRSDEPVAFPLVLNEPLIIMMNDGKPTGDMRSPGGGWMHWQDSLQIVIPLIKAEYDPKSGAGIRSSLVVKTLDNFSH